MNRIHFDHCVIGVALAVVLLELGEPGRPRQGSVSVCAMC